jgi:hypothetical protein
MAIPPHRNNTPTETDFTQKTPSVVESYVDFETVFDKNIFTENPKRRI